jgi:hypothetical protein
MRKRDNVSPRASARTAPEESSAACLLLAQFLIIGHIKHCNIGDRDQRQTPRH